MNFLTWLLFVLDTQKAQWQLCSTEISVEKENKLEELQKIHPDSTLRIRIDLPT